MEDEDYPVTLTIDRPDLDLRDGGNYPYIPEGATSYERQEINRLYREAMSNYSDTMERIAENIRRVAQGVPNRNPFANDAQHLAMGIGAEQALAATLDGVLHRLAIEKRKENPDG